MYALACNSKPAAPQRRACGQTGFTLIELVVTLAVLAVLISLGLPSFREMIDENRMASQGNELVYTLRQARALAVERAAPVSVVAIDGDWNEGWDSLLDYDKNGAKTTGLADAYVTRTPAAQLPDLQHIDIDASATRVTFLPDGTLNSTTSITLELTPKSHGTARTRRITIALSGRSEIAKT
jgi:type IV fimbrial biogenesis protein FimT